MLSMRPLFLSFAVLASVALLASPANAREDSFEPGTLGMGGAVRILGGDVSAIRLNPASMIGKPTYYVGVSYSFFGRERSHLWSTGAYDSKTSAFGMGSSYSLHIYTPTVDPASDLNWYKSGEEIKDKHSTHRWELAVAYGLLERRINFGVTGRVLRHVNALEANTLRFSVDTGIIFYPLPVLGIGVSAQNMIPTKDERFPTRVSGGMALSLPHLLDLGVDAVIDLTSQETVKVDVHAGLTVRLFQIFLIRAGYYGDRGFIDNYVTWGLGLDIQADRRFGIDFGMRIEVGPVDGSLRPDRQEGPQRILNSLGMHIGF
jgi:hypothetical protein